MASPAAVSLTLHRLASFKTPAISTPTNAKSATSPKNSSSPLDAFANDPILSAFLSPTFSSTSFSFAALSSGSPASTAEHLHQAIRLLQNQLRSEVLSRHPDLLNQLSSLNHAEHAVSTVRSAISSLQSSVRRVQFELSDPYKSIKSKTVQLSNLHSTTEFLQHTIRAFRLSKKFRDLITAAEAEPEKLDLTRAAQLHWEIVTMCKEYDLIGIDGINEELLWVKEVGEKLRNEAMKVLEGGMEGLNHAQVGTGLQVFYNLGELKATVEHLVNMYKNMGVKSITLALDMKAISGGGGGFGPGGIRGSGTPHIGGGVKAREGLWQRMENCMDQLHSIVIAVWNLQRVLLKKRDPFSQVLLLDEVIQVSGLRK